MTGGGLNLTARVRPALPGRIRGPREITRFRGVDMGCSFRLPIGARREGVWRGNPGSPCLSGQVVELG